MLMRYIVLLSELLLVSLHRMETIWKGKQEITSTSEGPT